MADTTTWFIVMELMDRNLEKVIHSNEEMSVSFIVRVLKEISIALLFMHTSALLHRDIKPANILVTFLNLNSYCKNIILSLN